MLFTTGNYFVFLAAVFFVYWLLAAWRLPRIWLLLAASYYFYALWNPKFFALLFSWLLGQEVRDTLCGTKVLFRKDYERIAAHRAYFGDFDPFGRVPRCRARRHAGRVFGGVSVDARLDGIFRLERIGLVREWMLSPDQRRRIVRAVRRGEREARRRDRDDCVGERRSANGAR
jgi:hypothetical protein